MKSFHTVRGNPATAEALALAWSAARKLACQLLAELRDHRCPPRRWDSLCCPKCALTAEAGRLLQVVDVIDLHPELLERDAVKGMLPDAAELLRRLVLAKREPVRRIRLGH